MLNPMTIDHCKSLLCSMFNEQTCSRFTWLFVVVRHHAQNIFENLILLYFWKAQGPRTSKLIFPTVKYTNTQIQIQIHKYSFVEVPRIPNICYISKQLLIQGCQKWYSQVSKGIRYENWSDNRSDIRSVIRSRTAQQVTADFCSVTQVYYIYCCAVTQWDLEQIKDWIGKQIYYYEFSDMHFAARPSGKLLAVTKPQLNQYLFKNMRSDFGEIVYIFKITNSQKWYNRFNTQVLCIHNYDKLQSYEWFIGVLFISDLPVNSLWSYFVEYLYI